MRFARLGQDALLHFAWYTEHGRYWTAAENLAWVGSTLNLLRVFREAGGRRAVLAGSCAEYEWGVEPVFTETVTPLRPATLYGAAKHATNMVALAYAESVGLALVWGRVLSDGPGEHPQRLLSAVARSLLSGHLAKTTNGTQVRDFMHVQDVAAGFIALLDSSVVGSVNVGSGQAVEVRRLIELVATAAGRPDLVQLGALPRPPGDPESIVANVDPLSGEVGFRPRISLQSGVTETVEWCRGTLLEERESHI